VLSRRLGRRPLAPAPPPRGTGTPGRPGAAMGAVRRVCGGEREKKRCRGARAEYARRKARGGEGCGMCGRCGGEKAGCRRAGVNRGRQRRRLGRHSTRARQQHTAGSRAPHAADERERAPESAPPFPLSDASCGCRSRRVVVSCAGSIQARAPLAGSAFGSSVCCALLVRRRGLLLDRRRHRAQHSTQRCWAAAAHPSFARRQHPGGHRPPCTSSCGPTRRLSATLRRRV
jgi:hypothetical protein